MSDSTYSAFQLAQDIFKEHEGLLRTSQAVALGISPRTLYRLRDAGIIEKLSHGLYRLSDLPPVSNPDLIRIAMRVPNGVVCTISALSFHSLTTEVPHVVHVALKRGAEPPRLEYPPLKVYWFTGSAFSYGIETHELESKKLRVYSPEKTIADCFKYRNKLGLDVALEALKRYRERGSMNIVALIDASKSCRVEKVMRPYLETLL